MEETGDKHKEMWYNLPPSVWLPCAHLCVVLLSEGVVRELGVDEVEGVRS